MDEGAVRERLLLDRQRLQREIAELGDELSQSLEDSSGESPYDQHMAEAATATVDREIVLTLQDKARALLAQIDRALGKLENGSYGKCDKCGRPIDEDRLQAVPSATLCIECRRLEERNR